MAVPLIMSIDQMQMPEACFQQMQVVAVPYCFVAAPEFCEGMPWAPQPAGGCEPMWTHGQHRGPFNARQGRYNRGYTKGRTAPARWQLPAAALPQEESTQQESSSQDPVGVELTSLPKMLCNRACLEAAIEQAGLESDVQSLELDVSTYGKATLLLSSQRAAQRCVRHFDGLRWQKFSDPVSARYCPQAEEEQQQLPESQVTVVEALEKATANKPSVSLKASAKSAAPTPKSTISPCSSPKSTASTITPNSSPKSTFSTPTNKQSMKPRWADYDSDSDEDMTSTRAGTFAEAPSPSDSGDSSNTES